jgi:hypothetical protein
VAANTFVADNQYEWQVRSTGQKSGTQGPWSASAFFTATAPPPAPTVIHPAAGEIITNTQYNVTWTLIPGQQSFHLIIYGDDGAGALDPTMIIFDSGVVGGDHGGDNVWPVVWPTGDMAFHVALSVIVGGVSSPASNVYGVTSISAPQAPTFFLTAIPASGAIGVYITNPTTDTSRPAAAHNDVYRSAPGEDEIRVATNVAVNGNWIDWTPASKVVYTYRVSAVAVTGAAT